MKKISAILLALTLCAGILCIPQTSGTSTVWAAEEGTDDDVIVMDGYTIPHQMTGYTNFILFHETNTDSWFQLFYNVTDIVVNPDVQSESGAYLISCGGVYCFEPDGTRSDINCFDYGETGGIFGQDITSNYISSANITGSDGTVIRANYLTSPIAVPEINFSVSIPKTVTLSGTTKKASYTICISGTIPENMAVSVQPVDADTGSTAITEFYMQEQSSADNAKAPVTATVTQERSVWTRPEVAAGVTATENTISAEGLSAGDWSGTFSFAISLCEAGDAEEDE